MRSATSVSPPVIACFVSGSVPTLADERQFVLARVGDIRQQRPLQGPDRCLGTVLDANLAQDRLNVNLDGGLGDLELICDDLVRCTIHQAFQDYHLAAGELYPVLG